MKLIDARDDGRFWIQDAVIDGGLASRVGAVAFLVYAVLVRHANRNAVTYPSLQTIGREAGVSVAGVKRALAVLREHALIEREQAIGAHGSYALTKILTIRAASREGSSRVSHPPGSSRVSQGGLTGEPTPGSRVSRPVAHGRASKEDKQKEETTKEQGPVVAVLSKILDQTTARRFAARLCASKPGEAKAIAEQLVAEAAFAEEPPRWLNWAISTGRHDAKVSAKARKAKEEAAAAERRKAAERAEQAARDAWKPTPVKARPATKGGPAPLPISFQIGRGVPKAALSEAEIQRRKAEQLRALAAEAKKGRKA